MFILRNIPILCYHDVNTPGGHSLKIFKSHLDVIEDMGFVTIDAQYLYKIIKGEKSLDKRYIVLTFDDCHLSNYLYTIPELSSRNMHGIFFTITDFIGQDDCRTPQTAPQLKKLSHSMQQALRDKDYNQFMSQAEIKDAIHNYGMEVYAHSARHQGCFRTQKQISNMQNGHWSAWGIYPKFDPLLPAFEYGSAYAYNGYWPSWKDGELIFKKRTSAQRYEFCLQDFSRSMARIRELTPYDNQFFCWPWGHFDKLGIKALQECGFVGSFTLERSFNGPGTNPYRLNRIGIGRKKDARWLRNRLLMHMTPIGARTFFKYFRKKDEA